MISRIKYIIKKKKQEFILLIKNIFKEVELMKLSGKEKHIMYLKKMWCHPYLILKKIINKELNITYVEMVLTTRCTLNCKGCSALMNYYDKRNDINIDVNIKSLQRLLNCCNSINHLRLLGGEPLLYSKLLELLLFLNKQEKIKRITIVTNGTLLIKDDKIIEILKNNTFDVFISNYGNNSSRKDELIKQLKINNIKYELGSEDKLWRDYGNLDKRNRSKKELRKQFLNCNIMCTSILNGNIHHCPRSSHGTNIKKIPLRKQDYIYLLDENINERQLKKELYRFFNRYTPYIEACDYCNYATNELKMIPAGEQYKK